MFSFYCSTQKVFELRREKINYDMVKAYHIKSPFVFRYLCLVLSALCYLSTSPKSHISIRFLDHYGSPEAILRLQITDDATLFIVRRLQRWLRLAAKVGSPMVFSLQVADSSTLAIMVQLLEQLHCYRPYSHSAPH